MLKFVSVFISAKDVVNVCLFGSFVLHFLMFHVMLALNAYSLKTYHP